MEILNHQYNLVLGSRGVVLDYCETISREHLTKELKNFGRGGSIRDLLVHIANTYRFWLDKYALNRTAEYFDSQSVKNVNDMRKIFDEVNETVDEFLNKFGGNIYGYMTAYLDRSSGKQRYTTSPIALFTHVITHEYHHKGQIMTISRHLGYTPPDADVLR